MTEEVTASSKGSKPRQWSARKAPIAAQAYKAQGGGYKGKTTEDNHLQRRQDGDWGTRSGKKSASDLDNRRPGILRLKRPFRRPGSCSPAGDVP